METHTCAACEEKKPHEFSAFVLYAEEDIAAGVMRLMHIGEKASQDKMNE